GSVRATAPLPAAPPARPARTAPAAEAVPLVRRTRTAPPVLAAQQTQVPASAPTFASKAAFAYVGFRLDDGAAMSRKRSAPLPALPRGALMDQKDNNHI